LDLEKDFEDKKLKYKLKYPKKKNETSGGAYWRDSEFDDHLKLTEQQTFFQYLISNYPPPIEILEAGCGLGRWVIPLSEIGYSVTGIEIEKNAIDLINQNYQSPNLTLVNGDIFDMPFSENHFDIILSLGVLEHFETQELQDKAITEHLRLLKDDGLFFVTVPFLSFIRFLIHRPFTKLVSFVRKLKHKTEYFSEYRYTKNEFSKVLKSSGLEIIDFVYDDLLPPYNFGFMDYPIKKLFKKNTDSFKLNKLGCIAFEILWSIHPKLVSGGIGFVCRKKK